MLVKTRRQASKRSAIPPFIVMDVMTAAARAEAAGQDIVHMEVGEPGSPPPRLVRQAAAHALASGPVGYTQALGLPNLRARIARHYGETYDLDLSPARVIVTTGSSAGFVLAFLVAFDAGARLGVPVPGYPAYRHTASALSLEPVLYRRHDELDMTSLAGVLVASPNNPTGTLISPAELSALARKTKEQGLWLISDEIYHGLTYGAAAQTALKYDDEAIVINSFSKYYCMTGWRVGWMVVPEQLVRPIERLTQNLSISAPYLSQGGAIAAFDAIEELEEIKSGYAQNRALLREALPEIGFKEIYPMDGAFYAYAKITPFAKDSADFASRMLAQAGVAATPGLDFDPIQGRDYIRFSYAGAEERIALGLERLKNWLS